MSSSKLYSSIPTVSFSGLREMLLAAHDAQQAILVVGDPGIGKSAAARALASEVAKPLRTFLGSTADPTDVPGLPVVVAGKDGHRVERVSFKEIRAACDEPSVLFLDELSCSAPAVQAALLRLILERTTGERALHPESFIVAAANPPEQAPGGFELSSPLMGRVCIVRLRPTAREVLDFFSNLGEEGSTVRAEATDFALTAEVMPELLQIDIPSAAVSGDTKWGSPRDWERAVRLRASVAARGGSAGTLHAVTSGSVGEDLAAAFRAVVNLRKELPGIGEIVSDPAGARLPENKKHQIAALGLIPRVADENTWAAWVYANRLEPEMSIACANVLLRRKDSPLSAKWAKEGAKARVFLSSKVSRIAS